MKRKKNSGDEKDMAGNKKLKIVAMLPAEMICMALAALGIWAVNFMGMIKQQTSDMVSQIVLTVLGIAALGFCIRKGVVDSSLSYDNSEHPGRFWMCFEIGLAVAFVCVFLPEAAWPFLPVYVFLGLFGSMGVGILGATVLLGIAVSQTGAGTSVFMMYLISGVFGMALFNQLKNGFKAGFSIALSLAGLLVCETAGTVLVANARPGWESFVLPAANLLVSWIMLLGILKSFSEKVLYKHRENYLDLNDTENVILADLKQSDRRAYMKSIHTAYFCERIAMKLGLNIEALKCAGYYHGMGERLSELMEMYAFPPQVVEILEEYQDRKHPVRHKETAVLMASENIINAVLLLLENSGGRNVDYDKVIDAIFAKYSDAGTFDECDISIKEFHDMHRIFKEAKLYYDFLR